MTGLNVVPNLKKGKIFLASNYRPLSLTLVTSKILECIYVITFGSTWKIIMCLVTFNMVSASRSHYGIQGSLLSWIQVFLTKRTQRVALESVLSNQCFLTSGVSQGTVLGLLLFLIYINDLPLCISSTMRLFTDDCFLYRSINSPVGCQNIQRDLDALTKWEKD